MKIIIAGGRNFNNYELLQKTINEFEEPIEEVVCGMARGADLLGKQWAEEHNIPVKEFPAEWEKFGKAAGIIRNSEMGNYADYLIAFWDGKSHGTKNMIDYMQKHNKHGKVIYY